MTQYSGVYTLQNQGQALTSGQWATEPYFKNTTLLLHADGVAGGAQNNTFLDSSTNAFAITRNGNTTQGTFSPYGPDWSNYFSSSAMLNTASSASFDFGTGDFTLEAWVNLDSVSTFQTIFSTVDSGVSGGYSLGVNSSGFIEFDVVPAQSLIANSYPVKAGVWSHIAFTKSSGTYRAFVNGVLCTTSTNTLGTTINSSTGLCIGKSVASGYPLPLTGYISNARIVKGTALYTSNFAPSTFPLTNVSGTSILTCQSNRFVDNSSSPFSFTITASPSVQRFSPFPPQYQYTSAVIGGSGYFDGSSDSLASPQSATFNLSSGNWTIEGWFYSQSSLTSSARYFVMYPSSGNIYGVIDGAGTVSLNNFGYSNLITGSISNTYNAWQHVALVKNGSTTTLYVNGAVSGSGNVSYINADTTIFFGGNTGSYAYSFLGYIADARVVIGTAVYTSAFTPPTSPLTAVSNTALLISMANAGILDNTMMNNLETVGNAQVSTSVVKYGSGSLYFDGTGDYLQAANRATSKLGTGDFTVEAWIYLPSVSAYQCVVSIGRYLSNVGVLRVTNAAKLQWYFNDATFIITSSATISASTWTHVASVRYNGVTTLYINGVNVASAADTSNYNSTYPTTVGAEDQTSIENLMTGYIDDLRITKGVARYTSNFIPPQVAFANQ